MKRVQNVTVVPLMQPHKEQIIFNIFTEQPYQKSHIA